MPFEYFVLWNVQFVGEVIGYLAGLPIREAVVDTTGTRYRFAGIAPRDCDGRLNVNLLNPGEWIVQPGLIYAVEDPPSH
jgi:hypothetical protein